VKLAPTPVLASALPLMVPRLVLASLLILGGQACDHRNLSAADLSTSENTRAKMSLRVRLGEGFQGDTVTVLVDGKQVYGKSGVSTDLTISYADAVDIPTNAHSVQLEVSVQGGPRAVSSIQPAQTPFVQVHLRNGALQLRALSEELPML